MRLLKLVSCFFVVFFLSCEPDNIVYFVEGQVKSFEQQEINESNSNQKQFSFDLNKSNDFKVYVKELSELSTLNLTIKSNIDLKSGNFNLIIDDNQYELKNSSLNSNNSIEISDPDLLAIISSKLLKNKQFNLLLEGNNLNGEDSFNIEMTLDLEGTFLGLH